MKLAIIAFTREMCIRDSLNILLEAAGRETVTME